jgi:hypothetical protein
VPSASCELPCVKSLRLAATPRESRPELPVLLLSQYPVLEYANRLLAQGADDTGYLLKDDIAPGSWAPRPPCGRWRQRKVSVVRSLGHHSLGAPAPDFQPPPGISSAIERAPTIGVHGGVQGSPLSPAVSFEVRYGFQVADRT